MKTKNMNYCGMYNWTNDLPVGQKKFFVEALDYTKQTFPAPKILEIGVFAGTSLITILKHLPMSTAVAIDTWSLTKFELDNCNKEDIKRNIITQDSRYTNEYVKTQYTKNIETENVQDRIITINQDSCSALRHLLRENKKFDFIYIDGSHMAMDVMTDIVLGWELLNQNGMFVIDDYLWDNGLSPTEKPKVAIDTFLKKYKTEYKIFNINYRVFLIKK